MTGEKAADVISMEKEDTSAAHSNKEMQLMARASAEFARKQLAPNREENDKYPFGPYFSEVVEKAFELDFFHMLLPEEMNGMAQGVEALSVILENICREDSSLGGILFTTLAAQEVMRHAGNDQTLKAICDSDTVWDFLIALPVFNNPAQVKHLARARRSEGRYLLSGGLEYLVLGNVAKRALIPAVMPDREGYAWLLADLENPGIQKSEPILSLGLHGCPAVDIEFNQTEAVLIGEEGKGAVYFESMADRMHAAATAMSVGIMKGAFQEALDYARNRDQGGQKIIHWSELKMILANMALKISNAEMILAQACRAVDLRSPGWASRARAAKHIQALMGIAPVKKIRFLDDLVN